MPCVQRLRELLESLGANYDLIRHSRAFTAQEIAASMHVPGRELAKTVVVRTERGLALVVVRAPDQIDLARAGRALDGTAVLAGEDELAQTFPDCELGAMPPLGVLYRLPTLVDRELAKDPEIVFNAGTHTDAIRMTFAEYARLARPRIVDVALRVGELVG